MKKYAFFFGTAHNIVLAAACLIATSALGQVSVAPQAGNKLTVSATATVNLSSGLYTYSYSFTNAGSSEQQLWFIAIELNGDAATGITNVISPKGWQALPAGGTPGVSWAATQIDTVPANFVDDGSVLPSPYQVPPGSKLGGFSFQSPRPPTTVKFYAQGFTPLPAAVDADDLPAAGYTLPDYTNDSVIGVTQGPVPSNSSLQPSEVGFFDFVGLINNAVVKAAPIVGVQFNSTAATVNTTSFQVILNGVDVTNAFKSTGQGTNLSGNLSQVSSLKTGVNLLEGIVSGTLNGQAQVVYDSNEVKFYLGSTRSLDLNGDGKIDCLDIAIVRASFGRSSSQSGFDPRADVDGNGMVNIVDLSTVARALPAGTVCK